MARSIWSVNRLQKICMVVRSSWLALIFLFQLYFLEMFRIIKIFSEMLLKKEIFVVQLPLVFLLCVFVLNSEQSYLQIVKAVINTLKCIKEEKQYIYVYSKKGIEWNPKRKGHRSVFSLGKREKETSVSSDR